MKKILLLSVVAVLFASVTAFAQKQLKNNSFENWTEKTIYKPKNFVSSPDENITLEGILERSTDAHDGLYSIKLKTIFDGSDLFFGYFVNFNPEFFSGGAPFTFHAENLELYYKAGIEGADSALIITIFKKNGVPIAQSLYKVDKTMNTNNWTKLTIPTNLPAGVDPDSVMFGVASSNAMSGLGMTDGSWIMIDHIVYTNASGSVTIDNSSLEEWDEFDYNVLNDFMTYPYVFAFVNETPLERTLDASDGTYALKLNTSEIQEAPIPGVITNSTEFENMSGEEFTWKPVSVSYDYQNFRAGADEATVLFEFNANGNTVAGSFKTFKDNTNGYSSVTDTLNFTGDPDSLFFAVSNGGDVGSWFIIDNIVFDYPLGITENVRLTQVVGYPNPATDVLNLRFVACKEAPAVIAIYDLTGKLIVRKQVAVNSGETMETIDVSHLPQGNYLYSVEVDGECFTRKFVKQ